jgi:hypothetical protein
MTPAKRPEFRLLQATLPPATRPCITTVLRIRDTQAAAVLGPAPEGVRTLGVDEIRVRSVRWLSARPAGAVGPVDDQLRRPRPGPPGRAAGVGTRPLRGVGGGAGCPCKVRSCAPVSRWWRSTRRRRSPPSCGTRRCCRTRPWWSTTGIYTGWPTRCSPRSAAGSPGKSTATAAARATTCGPTIGCYCATGGNSPTGSGPGSNRCSSPTTPTGEILAALAGKE